MPTEIFFYHVQWIRVKCAYCSSINLQCVMDTPWWNVRASEVVLLFPDIMIKDLLLPWTFSVGAELCLSLSIHIDILTRVCKSVTGKTCQCKASFDVTWLFLHKIFRSSYEHKSNRCKLFVSHSNLQEVFSRICHQTKLRLWPIFKYMFTFFLEAVHLW